MKAVELGSFEGLESLRVTDVEISRPVPGLLELISQKKVKLFANHSFLLAEVKKAFQALASRRTIGKVVLFPSWNSPQTVS